MNFRTFLLTATVSAVSSPAFANTSATDSPLEEIVVSEFRSTLVTDLPTSITQFGQDTIENAAIANFEELIPLVPNMNWSGEGSRVRYLQLRGIGELEAPEGAPNPSVGFIIDDINLSGVGGIATTFDMSQTEVLRGPQATRFGANALAGMVYLESENPTDELNINSELTAGTEDTYALGGAVGGALSDSVGARLSVFRFKNNGYRTNTYLGVDDTNERDEFTTRGKVVWNIANDWQLKVSGLYADADNGYDAWVVDNGENTLTDKPGRDEQKTAAASVKVSGPLGNKVNFVSITGYAETDIYFSFDGDWGNDDSWSPNVYDFVYQNDRKRKVFTQEFRLLSSDEGRIFADSTDWLVGIYAQSLDEKNDILSAGDADGWLVSDYTVSDYDSDNLALFGRLNSVLNDRWSLSAGLRFERWQADYNDSYTDQINAPGAPVMNEFKPKENMWGGDLSLSYQVTDNARLYGLISRGYKAGGFNPSLARLPLDPGGLVQPEDIAFDPESLWNYELGVKGLWADGTVLADFVFFYNDREDMQIRSSAQLEQGNPNDFVFITSNGAGYSYGIETSLAWQVSDNWKLYGSLGILESKVSSYEFNSEESEVSGREFAHAPGYNANIGAEYRSDSGWFGRLDVNAKDAFYYDYSHDNKSKSYQLVNAKFGKEWGSFAAYVWGRNLTDETYYTRGFYFANDPNDWVTKELFTRYGDPRTVGVTLNYRIR